MNECPECNGDGKVGDKESTHQICDVSMNPVNGWIKLREIDPQRDKQIAELAEAAKEVVYQEARTWGPDAINPHSEMVRLLEAKLKPFLDGVV